MAILICEMAGVVGSVFTFPNIAVWYAQLNKPPFSPPNWLFAPVWTALYALMGLAAFLVWEKGWKSKAVKEALVAFSAQLTLNVMWSVAFFGARSPKFGFATIVLLWASIAATIYEFWKVDRKAALLMVPYITWVSLAAVLNYYVIILN
jgi:translocator protein